VLDADGRVDFGEMEFFGGLEGRRNLFWDGSDDETGVAGENGRAELLPGVKEEEPTTSKKRARVVNEDLDDVEKSDNEGPVRSKRRSARLFEAEQ
jgi:hypothetical protein